MTLQAEDAKKAAKKKKREAQAAARSQKSITESGDQDVMDQDDYSTAWTQAVENDESWGRRGFGGRGIRDGYAEVKGNSCARHPLLPPFRVVSVHALPAPTSFPCRLMCTHYPLLPPFRAVSVHTPPAPTFFPCRLSARATRSYLLSASSHVHESLPCNAI